jgi:hypothetical protein
MGRQPSLDGAMEGSRERRRNGWKRGRGVVMEWSVGLGSGREAARCRDGSERRPVTGSLGASGQSAIKVRVCAAAVSDQLQTHFVQLTPPVICGRGGAPLPHRPRCTTTQSVCHPS